MAGADTAVVIPSAGGLRLRTRSGLITKGYRKLGVEDFEENFVAALPKTLPDPIGKKGPLIMKIKDGYGVEISIPQEAAL